MRQQIIDAVEDAYVRAEKHYGRTFKRLPILFTLKGAKAGIYRPFTHFNFNLQLAMDNAEAFTARTTYHEVSHDVSYVVYGPQIRPHGREWRFVMKRVMGLEPSRCHTYDTSNVKRARRKVAAMFPYECGCGVRHLTVIRHRRAMSGRGYRCVLCGLQLKSVG
jgi:SprT protein